MNKREQIKIEDFKVFLEIYKKFDNVDMEIKDVGLERVSIIPKKYYNNEPELFIRVPWKFLKEDIPYILTIARMGVQNKNKGIGSKIIEEFIILSKKKNIDMIEIESVSSEDMIHLCKKFKFKPLKNSIFVTNDGKILGNYRLVITQQLSDS